jgi:hypothetical protein
MFGDRVGAVVLERFGQYGHSGTPSFLPLLRCPQAALSTHSNNWVLWARGQR